MTTVDGRHTIDREAERLWLGLQMVSLVQLLASQ